MQIPLLSRRVGALSLGTILTLSLLTPGRTASAEEGPQASEEVIISASRLETSPKAIASSVTVVDNVELEQGQYKFVAEALESVPGLDVVQSGGPGGNTAAFLRGLNSEHTLVMLDGIELNNPGSTSRSFNFSTLTLENIDRIEIVRGPQSTIYGSDALGGVINIISKRAQPGFGANLSAEAGSYDSFTEVANASLGSDLVDLTVGATRQDFGSISAADASFGNSEHDKFENTSLSTRARVYPSEAVDFGGTVRYVRSHSGLDNFGGAGGDDPNRRLGNEEFFTRTDATTHLLDDSLSQTIGFSYSTHELRDDNDPDEISADFLRSNFNGDIQKLDFQNRWTPCEQFSLVIGAETERERADSMFFSDGAFGPFEDNLFGRSTRTNAYFMEARFAYEKRAFLDTGIRVDDNSQFGTETTYRIAPAVLVTEMTKLRGSVGTGFKAPSLVQLYSSFGNPDLQAEQSVGWDVGIDQELLTKTWSVSATYFRNDIDELVTFNPSTFVLENINEAETAGLEFTSSLSLTKQLELQNSYTYTDSEDKATGDSLLRRPRNKVATIVSYTPCDRFVTHLRWRVYGGSFDNDFSTFPPTRVRLGGYGVVDLALSYRVTDSVELTSRIENLFDKEFEEVLGFGTPGLAAYGGVKVLL